MLNLILIICFAAPYNESSESKSKIISLLLEKFSSETKLFENYNPILTASVPVIKLQSDISKLMSEETKNALLKNSNAFLDRNNVIWLKESILTIFSKISFFLLFILSTIIIIINY